MRDEGYLSNARETGEDSSQVGVKRDSLGRRLVEQHHRPKIVIHAPGDWALEGVCREVDPDMWYPNDGTEGKPAKRICNICPVKPECLDWAMRNEEPHGIWGGLSPRQRATLRRKGTAA